MAIYGVTERIKRWAGYYPKASMETNRITTTDDGRPAIDDKYASLVCRII